MCVYFHGFASYDIGIAISMEIISQVHQLGKSNSRSLIVFSFSNTNHVLTCGTKKENLNNASGSQTTPLHAWIQMQQTIFNLRMDTKERVRSICLVNSHVGLPVRAFICLINESLHYVFCVLFTNAKLHIYITSLSYTCAKFTLKYCRTSSDCVCFYRVIGDAFNLTLLFAARDASLSQKTIGRLTLSTKAMYSVHGHPW